VWPFVRTAGRLARHEATVSATKARQGITPGVVRWVLGISLLLAILGMFVAYWIA
jgi:hypothetical protein